METNMESEQGMAGSKISDIVYGIDVNGKFTYLNDSVKRLGYEPRELIRRHFSVIIPDKDVAEIQRSSYLSKRESGVSVSVKNPGFFDERRTGKRITRNLNVRLIPNSKTSLDPVSCSVNAAGFYDYPAVSEKLFMGTVGIIRIFRETAEVVDLITSFYASAFRLVSSIKNTGEVDNRDRVINDYYSLIRASGAPVFLLTHDGTILYAGRSTALLLGYSQEEIAGSRISDYIFSGDIDLINNMLNSRGENDPLCVSQCRIKAADNSWILANFRAVPVVDVSGSPLFIEFIMEDYNLSAGPDYSYEHVSYPAEKSDPLSLRQSGNAFLGESPVSIRYAPQNDLRWMTEMINEAVFILNPSGEIQYASRRITSLINYTPEEITGLNFSDLISEKDSMVFADMLLNLTSKKNRDIFTPPPLNEKELDLKKNDGSSARVLLRCRPFFDDSGEISGFGLIAGKPGHKSLEKELIHCNAGETFQLFAGGIAHDFRNFLTSINAGIELVKMNMDENHPDRESLFYAERAVSMASELASQLLCFSKNGIPAGPDASVSEILHNTASFALYGSKIKWRLLLYDDLSNVLIGSSKLGRIILNLIINARQAISGRGSITICGEKIRIERDNAESIKPGNYIKLSIEDTGCGIPEKDIPFIFDVDYSTRGSGGGLGLAICRSIVEENGGYIEVKSLVGSGTTFSVFFPASDDPLNGEE